MIHEHHQWLEDVNRSIVESYARDQTMAGARVAQHDVEPAECGGPAGDCGQYGMWIRDVELLDMDQLAMLRHETVQGLRLPRGRDCY